MAVDFWKGLSQRKTVSRCLCVTSWAWVNMVSNIFTESLPSVAVLLPPSCEGTLSSMDAVCVCVCVCVCVHTYIYKCLSILLPWSPTSSGVLRPWEKLSKMYQNVYNVASIRLLWLVSSGKHGGMILLYCALYKHRWGVYSVYPVWGFSDNVQW